MRREAGFTLLEVLVAFAILVLVLSTMYQRMGLGMRMASEAAAEGAVAEAADQILTELGRSRPLTYGISEGDLPSGQHWRLLISPTRARPPGAPLPRLEGHNVTLTLSWWQRGAIRTAAFDTVLLGMER
jgi:general secretion pathway protein I